MDKYIRFSCQDPACGKRLKAPLAYVGRRVRCSCGKSVVIPSSEPLPPDEGALLTSRKPTRVGHAPTHARRAEERDAAPPINRLWPWFAGGGIALVLVSGAVILSSGRVKREKESIVSDRGEQKVLEQRKNPPGSAARGLDSGDVAEAQAQREREEQRQKGEREQTVRQEPAAAVREILAIVEGRPEDLGAFVSAGAELRGLGPAAADAMLASLEHRDAHVRTLLVSVLAYLGDTRVREPCLRMLSDPDPKVRYYAVLALVDLKDARAIPSLCAELRDPKCYMREAVARKLGEIGDERAIGPLLDVAVDQKVLVQSRQTAVEALGKLKATSAADKVAGLLSRSYGNGLGSYCRSCLRKLDWSPTTPRERVYFNLYSDEWKKGHWPDIGPVLTEDLGSNDRGLSKMAYNVLFRLSYPEAKTLLIEHFRSRGDKAMAEEFLNSGTPDLETVARNWATLHGYVVEQRHFRR